MIREDRLRETVAHFLQLPPESLTPETRLNGNLSRSIGRARLDAALREEIGISKNGIYTAATYGELAQALCGAPFVSSGPAAPSTSDYPDIAPKINRPHPPVHRGVGIDIQTIASLPEENDFWASPFYRSHFTRTEVAYAILQSNPRETFAGFWCAKEALKKAASRWSKVDWQKIEVLHDSDGAPYLQVDGLTVTDEYDVSISHTAEMAIAVVVGVPAADRPQNFTSSAPALVQAPEGKQETKLLTAVILILFLAVLAFGWYIVHAHK